MDENNTPVKRGRGRPPKKPGDPKSPYNRPWLSKYGQEYIEPGDNTKFIRHALTTMDMPPINYKDPEQVEERIDWYFRHCADSDMKPTVTGLCNAIGVHKDTIRTWYNGEFREDTHQAIIMKAYRFLEELWEDYMLNGKVNPVSGIFLGKNQWTGYQDKSEVVLTPNQQKVTPEDIRTIESKYAELPDDGE